jgi:uridine monophosphate synthetase
MSHSFFTKLEDAIARNQSLLCVGLDPLPEQAPAPYRRSEPVQTILAWNRAVIEATSDLVCAYKPNIAFYEAWGAPGMDALRSTLALIPRHIPIILDAKRGDIGSTASAYAKACFDEMGVDAVTLSPYLGRDSIEPFARYPDKGLFVLCHTSNPSAGDFQHLEISDWRQLDREPNLPLYLHVARASVQWSPNIALVVGATFPGAVEAVRRTAPHAWFLIPGVGAQGGDLSATLAAGLRDDGLGLIINVSRAVCQTEAPRAAAEALRSDIEVKRAAILSHAKASSISGQTWRSTSAPIVENERDRLVLALHELDAVRFGSFTLASGIQSPIYIDLRLLVSQPGLLAQAARAYARILADLPSDRVCGVPYAALPIATAVALETEKPLIYPRKEAKAHGLGKEIEGAWRPGERVVVIEDLITSGGSTIQTVEKLRNAGLIVEHVIVLIDREQGGVENLAAVGITAHSVLRLSEILDTLLAMQKLPQTQHDEVVSFLLGRV